MRTSCLISGILEGRCDTTQTITLKENKITGEITLYCSCMTPNSGFPHLLNLFKSQIAPVNLDDLIS